MTFSALTPSVESYLADYTRISNIKSFLSRNVVYYVKAISSHLSLATRVKDNFMGVPQQFAHTRFYTDFSYSFYIDEDYTLLKIFEG